MKDLAEDHLRKKNIRVDHA